MAEEQRRREVVNTYRLQVHAGFTFDYVRAALPYLAALGVTHLYLSPITAATPGSTHGYDVIDPTRLDPDLGGREAYERLVEAQRDLGVGQVVDIVPNHMGVAPGAGNPYWEDVLRNGRDSPYAALFDIDWDAGDGRVVLPVLGDALPVVLNRGEIAVEVDDPEDAWARYFDARFPLAPATVTDWREREPPPAVPSAEALRALLDRQHYSLESWRTGQARINYRRFFAIDTLAGVRAEEPEAFGLSHGLLLDLVRQGAVDGLRIDHPDGLLDPEGYLQRLARALGEAGAPEGYLVVEKILSADEALPETWPGHGTTGYEFMAAVTRVLVDPAVEPNFTALYERIAGGPQPWPAIEDECRRYVVGETLGPQIRRLAHGLFHAERAALGSVTAAVFEEAVLHLLAHLDRYRTCHRRDALDPDAPEVVARAHRRASAHAGTDVGGEALAHAARLLGAPPEGAARAAVMRLQQFMPAVQAKGLEDRAFYRYRRLLALNEVGGDPSMFGEPPAAFLDRLDRDASRWPRRMLSTATHDHKRGEDVRARLAALTELPGEWEALVGDCFEEVGRAQASSPVQVAPTDVYLLLQTAVGTLPAGMTPALDDADYIERIVAYLQKALREAAERTDWVDGDEAYEAAVESLTRRVLEQGSPVRDALEAFAARLAPLGAVNSLAQVLLRVAGPGVTDTYQGNELWDLSLVDPDNRRPVDFAARAALIERIRPALEDREARRALAPGLLDQWRDGAVKAFVLARGLRARRERPAVFLGGSFTPLATEGVRRDHVIAFLREAEGTRAAAVAPRLSGRLRRDGRAWAPEWGDTTLALPAGEWEDAFTGASLAGGRAVPLAEILGAFPVALLLSDG